VTFFWNGNRSGYFDSSKETYLEIPSDNVSGGCGGGGVAVVVYRLKTMRETLSVQWDSSNAGSPSHARSTPTPNPNPQPQPPQVPFNQAPDMKALEIMEAGREALRRLVVGEGLGVSSGLGEA